MLKKITVTLLLVICVICSAFSVSADSFSRADVPGGVSETRLSREMYTATKKLTATSLGLEKSLVGITDIFCENDGDILLLCGDESRLVRIFADCSKGEEILIKDSNGDLVSYKGAKGIYCDKNGNLYICDTVNSRILVADSNGNVKQTLGVPESDLIPESFVYQPSALAIDEQGFTYILSLGCYYGALLYSPEGEFLGFYGANTSNATALDTLEFLWDKLTSTEAKKAASVRKLPYSFVDFAFDTEGYMVTCTGITNTTHWESLYDNGTGQIKKISHNGANILYKRSLSGDSMSSESVNFLESKLSFAKMQDIVSVVTSADDYIFALDKAYGLIYIYDSESNLMASFGGGFGKGEKLGEFKTPVSMSMYNNILFVADSENCSVTIFEPTYYGQTLRTAQNLYIKGDYTQAESLWQEVLSLNRNCQLAYRGIAMAQYSKGDYSAALESAKLAMDKSVYEMAWQEIVTGFIADNFVWMLLVLLSVIGAVIYLVIRMKKNNKKLINNPKIKLVFSAPFHPFESFRILKEKKQGSIIIAIIITVLFYVSSVLKVTSSGFLYTTTLMKNYNSLYTLGSTVGLLLLWSVSNWLVCSMFQGKGTLKEVYTASTYAIVPFVFYTFIEVILNNFLPYSCAGILNAIGVAVLIYTVFMLVVAMVEVHEYDFFKVLLTGIVIIFFMILIVFIILMCAILLKQFTSFIGSIYEEIAFR